MRAAARPLSAPGGASLSALKEGKSKSEQMSIHEIRNPIAAMRLKAENAMAAGNEDRRISAPQSILHRSADLTDCCATFSP
jgi:hypothetical protein